MLLGRNDTAPKKRGSESWKTRFHDYSSFDGNPARAGKRKHFNFLEIFSLPDFVKSVPQTDTGGQVEYTKASEKTILKELGNIAGRTFGRCPPASNAGSVNDAKRLFNKNTGLCKVERRCIGADTCPVLVG